MNIYTKNNIKYPYSHISQNIRISVKTDFLDSQSDEENNLWVWSYDILIENKGTIKIQLLDRHWIITDETGHVEEFKGVGVIGQQPTINPGNYFQYTSGAPLKRPSGFMTGSYNMINEVKKSFKIEIPTFSLDLPLKKRILN